jgi:glutathionyl-hydroquinone reductase
VLIREAGWRFPTAEDKDAEGEDVVPDPLHDDFTHLRQLYFESDQDYSGRFTVPVLYDKVQKRIVSNESSEILRMLGYAVSPCRPPNAATPWKYNLAKS